MTGPVRQRTAKRTPRTSRATAKAAASTSFRVPIVCRRGHVMQFAPSITPDDTIVGGISPCSVCGERAAWRRRAPCRKTRASREAR